MPLDEIGHYENSINAIHVLSKMLIFYFISHLSLDYDMTHDILICIDFLVPSSSLLLKKDLESN